MPPRLFVLGLVLMPISVWGQSGENLRRFDPLITRFLENGPADSFLFYTDQKLRAAARSDSLALWAWTWLERCDAVFDDSRSALATLDQAFADSWRPPRVADEWEPFLYLHSNRGWHLFQLGRVRQSVKAYETALQLYERHRFADFDPVEFICKPLGAHYTRLGDNEKALVVYQKAPTFFEKDGDAESLAGLYGNIGIAHWNMGAFAEAEHACRKGLDLPGISNAKRALLLGALARVQLDRGDDEQAAETAQLALQKLPASAVVRDPQRLEYRMYARLTAGVAQTRIGRFDAASRLLLGAQTDARSLYGKRPHRDPAKIEIALAALHLREKRPSEALAAANSALQKLLPAFRPKHARDNPDPADFYEENALFEALAIKAEVAESLFARSKDLQWLDCALDCHEKARQAEQRLREVLMYRSSKLGLLNMARIRETSAMRTARTLYEKTGSSQWIDRAFDIAERSKAALLLDALQENLARSGGDSTRALFAELHSARRSAAYFEKKLLLEPRDPQAPQWRLELDALTAETARLENEMRQRYPEWFRAKENANPGAGVPVQMDADACLIEYFVGDAWLDILIFSGQGHKTWHRVPIDAAFRQLIADFQGFFTGAGKILNDPDAYLRTAFGLYQKIVPEEAIRATEWIVVPDGFVHYIPFDALVEAPDAASLRQAPYLIRRHKIRYGWSWATLQRQQAMHSGAPGGLLGIAPGFAGHERGLAPLPNGAAEFRSFHSGRVDALSGANAVSDRLKAEAGRYKILHFSTHAFASAADSLPARIELYDQPLFLPDLYALPLRADLVVLSACQTGIGVEQKSEGVMSLARAFAHAGAACIISSMWMLNDRSAALLFDRMYRKLNKGEHTAGALRQAKLEYLLDENIGSTLQTPYFWAGLTLVGADRGIAPTDALWWPCFFVLPLLTGLFWMLWRHFRKRT
jgi:CHAT domain-containing protein